jgi:uncharacterized protein
MTEMRRWLVIMAKQPRAGRVKSRLARKIGLPEATRFYRVTLSRLLRTLGNDPRWTTVLAVAPDSAVDDRVWPNEIGVVGQGNGDLGARMQHIMTAMPPGPVIVIGSDIPDVLPRHIERAFCQLGDNDAVFGPARDGGYWLVGLKRRPHVPHVFKHVRWSTKHALKDTLKNCRRLSVGLAATLADVDRRKDWRKWRRGDPV